MNKTLPILFILLVSLSCKTKQKTVKIEKKQYDFSIIFGSGGGFTGLYNTYELQSNGSVFKVLEEAEPQLLKTIPADTAQKIFEKAEALGLEAKELKRPGNMNNYLGIKRDEKEHRLTWAVEGLGPEESILDFYTKLNELLRD